MILISTISQESKAARGTKRVCQACSVRFYDLARDPIVCPACAAEYSVVSTPAPTPHTSAVSFSNKSSWRSRSARAVDLPVYEPELPASDAPQDADADEPAVGAEEELVLEQDADDGGDYTELPETTVIAPEER